MRCEALGRELALAVLQYIFIIIVMLSLAEIQVLLFSLLPHHLFRAQRCLSSSVSQSKRVGLQFPKGL